MMMETGIFYTGYSCSAFYTESKRWIQFDLMMETLNKWNGANENVSEILNKRIEINDKPLCLSTEMQYESK